MIRTVCLVLVIASLASAGVVPKKVDKVDVGVKVGSLLDIGVRASKGVDVEPKLVVKRSPTHHHHHHGLVATGVLVGGVPSVYHDTYVHHHGAPVIVTSPGVHLGHGHHLGVGLGVGVGVFGK